ncbi:S-adenosyl-L-methionine-dependent tRNA 4-demethylwyosine synthase [Sciurus carolinensis]|uniref:S-adenosyl-L-methionine-dependent tRNA 4-demethylwyosine synthase TYW1 n=1 Tax=Sciurus carolinensis TaxID=30640 RepID=A0AA41MW75_SCICA|nr:S-adenosyl-L-methionine-dependent tRNA 4-demethylwyosine synthase [Sciurus carolinensis]
MGEAGRGEARGGGRTSGQAAASCPRGPSAAAAPDPLLPLEAADAPPDAWDPASALLSLWTCRFYLYLGFAVGLGVWICVQVLSRQVKKSQERSIPKATQDLMTNGYTTLPKKQIFVSGVKIFYGSQTGTAKGFATVLAKAVTSLDLPVAVINLKDYDPDDHLAEEVTSSSVCAFLVATYTDGRPTEGAEWFCKWLEEASSDFRFGRTYLKGMRYAVFGLGNSAYPSHFNKVGKNVDKWLWMLGARRVLARGDGDCDVVRSKHGSIEADFRAWKTRFVCRLQALQRGEKSCGGKCESKQHSSEDVEPAPHPGAALRHGDTKVGKNVDKWLWMLGARRVLARGDGDCDVVRSKHGSIEADFRAWKTRFVCRLQALQRGEKSCGGKCESKQHSSEDVEPAPHPGAALRHGDAKEEEPCESSSEEEFGADDHGGLSPVVDVEDLGKMMSLAKKEKREEEQQEERSSFRNRGKKEGVEGRAMLTPALREALTKQGYQLIGSHSGVKLCRWTKSMLRGRGGCYKHTFYGIESHRCVEATPSLACANKCVFCWRHHTNPVGTEWRWKMDQPEKILEGAVQSHLDMMKQFRGVPGVKAERFEEGMKVKHCALSLVGEPIMYPEINRFLQLLHQRKISSFLVTNAQFPAEIRNLKPVTQLYVSVDASTKDSLKKIDRPLFKDFWHRFLDSLEALATKQQRTVYRLTLVKSWNVDELQAYADLVSLGNPDFIEVKGVTYCGESAASSLSMANVPWHEEVVRFVRELVALIPDYEIACEHEHSNCLLVAHRQFKIDGEWWTWIDYGRFQELIQEYEDSGGLKTFSTKDYMAKTPPWAVFGARERGFDPRDTRYQRKSRSKDLSGC